MSYRENFYWYPNLIDRKIIDNLKKKVDSEYTMVTKKEINMYEATNTTTPVSKTYKFVRTWLVPDSDWVYSLAYDDLTFALQMKTKRGNTYVFENVSNKMFAEIMSGPSVGSAINYNLRAQFDKVM